MKKVFRYRECKVCPEVSDNFWSRDGVVASSRQYAERYVADKLGVDQEILRKFYELHESDYSGAASVGTWVYVPSEILR